ncbi:MAG: S-layer homology domain-containing protein [Lachnospiraceae bacterium]|nr:S-layer homology domain-containing protein [Lachnospiraceae bacterium]
MFYGKKTAALAMICAVSAGMTATAYGTESDFTMRKKTVSLLGIMNTGDVYANVSREEFARMLVNASEYRHVAGATSNVSVYADVLNTSEYASAIRTAAENGWMTGYLGGNFKPAQGVTYQEAVRAVMALLGYTNDDFAGNINGNRMAKFCELELDSNISRKGNEIMTREDCMDLFYNLLKADMKNGTPYGTKVFDLKYASDGEIDMSSVVDHRMKGPYYLNRDSRDLDDIVPFSLKNASMFLNGYASDEEEINDDALVVYYYEATKTIFAYSEEGENKGATEGEILAIYYDSADPFTPVRVVLDSDDQGTEEGEDVFQLSASEIQFLFSVYGEFKVGDDVVIIWEKNGNGENAVYTAIDVTDN